MKKKETRKGFKGVNRVEFLLDFFDATGGKKVILQLGKTKRQTNMRARAITDFIELVLHCWMAEDNKPKKGEV